MYLTRVNLSVDYDGVLYSDAHAGADVRMFLLKLNIFHVVPCSSLLHCIEDFKLTRTD